MSRSFLYAAALLTAGLVLGLGTGAWIWRGGAEQGAQARLATTARPPGPAALRRQADRADDEASGAATARPGGDRVAELAAKFRSIKEGEENVAGFVSGLVGLAGMTSEDFARLMGLLAEEKNILEVGSFPLLQWATVDPKAALTFALSVKDLRTTERIISAIVYEVAKVDLPAAKAALGQLEEEERRHSQRAIVRLLQQKDPLAGLAYARELNDAKAETDVLKYWAKSDPVAAAAELGAGKPGQAPAVEAVAAAWAKQDRAAFELWAASLTDPVGPAVARRAALTLDTFADPKSGAAETAAWLAREPAASEAADSLPSHIAQRWWWAKAPPQEVADWAASLPAGKAQDSALGEVARLWVEQDAEGASKWLGTLPPSPGRDQAVRHLVRTVSQDAPDEAFEWAGTIQSSGVRSEMLGASVRSWARKDAAAAQAAVATLPPERRGNLLEIIQQEQAAKK